MNQLFYLWFDDLCFKLVQERFFTSGSMTCVSNWCRRAFLLVVWWLVFQTDAEELFYLWFDD